MMHSKLAKQRRYVDFHCAHAQTKLASDLLVGLSDHDQVKNLALASGERLIFDLRERRQLIAKYVTHCSGPCVFGLTKALGQKIALT